MALTAKQQRFVDEYLIDLNATQAAIRSGYSEKTARSVGNENLTKPDIARAISARMQRTAAKAELTKDMIVAELRKIAFADIRKAVRWGKSPIDATSENASQNGLSIFPVELIPSEKIDDDTAAAVSEVSLTQTGIKIKMYDKRSALVDLAKMLGFVVDKVEHDVSDGLGELLKAIDGKTRGIPTGS